MAYNGALEYHWMHIPSGRKGIQAWSTHYVMQGITPFITELDKLRRLNEWNRAQPETWHYWMTV